MYSIAILPPLLIFPAQGMTVKNMSFKVGQTLTIVGVAKPEASK